MQIYQEFTLNATEIKPKTGRIRVNDLTTLLKKEGFDVLTNNERVGEWPTSILVGKQAGESANIKDQFYKLIEKEELPYRSGNWYNSAF